MSRARLDCVLKKNDSRWPEWTAISLFAALVAFAIPYHEPWADEAQAWQLARSLSLPALFQTYIRYEVSPGLWHFLLWVLIRAQVSYAGMHWLCGAIGVGAASLLVFRSPFPRYLKLVLPFTCFLLFQYAVVARSYVLVPILLFSIALSWKRGPFVMALLLGLLANVALHAAVISGGLALVYAFNRIEVKESATRVPMREVLTGAAILVGFYAFALWTAWPPRDLGYLGSTGRPVVVVILHILELFQPWLLSLPFWIAIALCLRARRALLFLLPVLFFMLFSIAVYASWWHVGLLFPLAICLLWITWPASEITVSRGEAIGRRALVAMACLQILWSAYAIEFDHFNAYSPDLAAAVFLRPFVQQGATIAVTNTEDREGQAFRSVGILPYYDRNIFINQPDSFWWCSTRNPSEERFLKVLPSRPALVVVEARKPDPNLPVDLRDKNIELLDRAGYRFTHMFCGAVPEGFELNQRSCHLIFQRFDDSPREPLANAAGSPSAAR